MRSSPPTSTHEERAEQLRQQVQDWRGLLGQPGRGSAASAEFDRRADQDQAAFEAGNKYQPAGGAVEDIGLGAVDDLLHGLVEGATLGLSGRLGRGGFHEPLPRENKAFRRRDR